MERMASKKASRRVVLLRFAYSMSVNVCCTMMLPLSRRVTVFPDCNISELNRATKEIFSDSLMTNF